VAGRPAGAGLVPDIVLDLDDEQGKQVQRYWLNEEGKAWNEIVRWPELGPDWVDPQLARALKLLEGELVLQKIRRSHRTRRSNG